jgi:multidrug resistance efflux pump
MVAQARLDAERAHKLAAAGAAGAAEVDLADTRLRTALADRDAAGQVLAELEAGARIEDRRQAVARADEARAAERLVTSGARVEDLTVARAQLDAARARVEQLDLAIAELEIRAPRDARVQSLSLRPGDLLTPNAPAATLLEDDQLFVRIYVPETVIGRVRVGQDVLISVDSFPGERFPGKVTFISEVGEYTPRNLQTADERADQVFAVRIEVAPGSARDRLRAGMAAFAHVER